MNTKIGLTNNGAQLEAYLSQEGQIVGYASRSLTHAVRTTFLIKTIIVFRAAKISTCTYMRI